MTTTMMCRHLQSFALHSLRSRGNLIFLECNSIGLCARAGEIKDAFMGSLAETAHYAFSGNDPTANMWRYSREKTKRKREKAWRVASNLFFWTYFFRPPTFAHIRVIMYRETRFGIRDRRAFLKRKVTAENRLHFPEKRTD